MAKGSLNSSNILVIHTAFLGDIVLATAFLRELRSTYPKSRIYFLTTPQGVELLDHNPWKIEAISFDKRGSDSGWSGWWRVLKHLRTLDLGLVFCLHRSLRSVALAKFLEVETWGFQEAAFSFLFHNRVSRNPTLYEAEKNLQLLEAKVGKRNCSPFPQLFTSPVEKEKALHKFHLPGTYAVIAPSSVWNTKRWPPSSFADLASRLSNSYSWPVFLVGGKSELDLETAKEVKEFYINLGGDRSLLVDLTAKTSLEEMKIVLEGAAVVISNDSSPLHMAIAMKTKVVGIFGPTTKSLGFFPLAPEGMAAVAEKPDLDCRPCGMHGHHQCPLTHFKCMRDLSVDEVMAQVSKLCR